MTSSAVVDDASMALSLRGLSKSFDGEKALDEVDLDIAGGEVHGLLGHNGSGKSTLIKILAGFHAPDPGATLFLHGEAVKLPMPPASARERGLAFVHQDLGLIGSATVAENITITEFSGPAKLFIDWRRKERSCAELLVKYGIAVSPAERVDRLTPVQKAMVAIARALQEIHAGAGEGRKVLVLDEPTAYLPRADVKDLFAVLRRLRDAGVATLFVSHNTDEVLDITDRLSVLRDGKLVGTRVTRTLDTEDVERMILGGRSPEALGAPGSGAEPRDLDTLPPSSALGVPPRSSGARVQGLSGPLCHDLDFEVRAGEVLGFTGLSSSGATDVPGLLFGAERALAGTLELEGRRLDLTRLRPHQAVRNRLAFVPGDRVNAGVIADLTLLENVTPLVARDYSRAGMLRRRRLIADAQKIFDDFQVRPSKVHRSMASLSGGNQQKVVLSKWMWNEPSLLLLEEPTQGVDVGACEEIFHLVRAAASRGAAVICAATDEKDLARLCDRVLVLNRGVIVAEYAGADVTQDNLRRASG